MEEYKYEQKCEIIVTGLTKKAVKKAMHKLAEAEHSIIMQKDIFGLYAGSTKIEKKKFIPNQ